jgi:hypothetical protein
MQGGCRIMRQSNEGAVGDLTETGAQRVSIIVHCKCRHADSTVSTLTACCLHRYNQESWTIPTHPCHPRIRILLTPHCKQLPSNHRAARFKSAFTRSREQTILEAPELHSLIRPQCGLTPQILHNSLPSTATGSAPESR